jgi:hypothetical protein
MYVPLTGVGPCVPRWTCLSCGPSCPLISVQSIDQTDNATLSAGAQVATDNGYDSIRCAPAVNTARRTKVLAGALRIECVELSRTGIYGD